MVGVIGHAMLIAAGQPGLDSLLEEWARDLRDQFPDVVIYIGRAQEDLKQIVIITLFPDRNAYQTFLDGLEADGWMQKFLQHVEGEISWEEIDVNQV